jgi:hypothetical protein
MRIQKNDFPLEPIKYMNKYLARIRAKVNDGTHLGQFWLENINLVQEENNRRPQEPL